MKQYLDLVRHVMEHGVDKEDRTGTGTRSVFGYQLRCDLADGFPLLTTKKVHLTTPMCAGCSSMACASGTSGPMRMGTWDPSTAASGVLGPMAMAVPSTRSRK